MTAFWDRVFARKLRNRVLPRSKLARIARAEARVAEKAKLDERRKPLDPSRPIPPALMWFALNVKSRTEFQVARWLEERGWFTLVPVKEAIKVINGKRGGKRRKEVKQTFAELSGFVFAGFPQTPDWLSLENCHAIYGPLETLGTPMTLQASDVSRFQQNALLDAQEAAQRASMADNLARIRKALEKGGKAKVKDGPFAGFEIMVHSIKGDLARAKIGLFGGEVDGVFGLDQLDAA